MIKLRNILMGLAVLSCTASFAQLPDAATIAPKMYPGWNLGNTMEGANGGQIFTNNVGLAGETAWQSTKTTQEVIDFVKAQGFKSVRIPCNWVCGHITDATNVTIDAAWMARVKEIVDYCVKDGLYVLLNDHWDGGWIQDTFSDLSDATVTKNCATMQMLWTQIANEFKSYDEHVLFAGLNEPGLNTTFNAASTAVLQKYEQAFIDAVRETGGNNATRTLVVQGPTTDIDQTYNNFDMANFKDPAGTGRLMVEVHFYAPWRFSGMEEDASWGKMWYFWGASNHAPSGSWASRNTDSNYEENFVKSQFQKMKTKYVSQGYPVLIGEYGCQWRDLGNTAVQKKHDASVKLYHKVVNEQAVDNGMVPFVWDINQQNQFGIKGVLAVLNRSAKTVFCTPAMEGIAAGVKAATWGGPVTGIRDVILSTAKNGAIYDLSGQRVEAPFRGICIRNGKKYFMR